MGLPMKRISEFQNSVTIAFNETLKIGFRDSS